MCFSMFYSKIKLTSLGTGTFQMFKSYPLGQTTCYQVESKEGECFPQQERDLDRSVATIVF